MASFRLSELAEADVAEILATSAEQWGSDAQRRYARLLATAIRKVALDPSGPTTRARSSLAPGVRSFHLRYVRGSAETRVKSPVHILYYRVDAPDVIEILRVLHERMEPSRHLDASSDD